VTRVYPAPTTTSTMEKEETKEKTKVQRARTRRFMGGTRLVCTRKRVSVYVGRGRGVNGQGMSKVYLSRWCAQVVTGSAARTGEGGGGRVVDVLYGCKLQRLETRIHTVAL
jgi:hypothetical protein